jgi:MFS family permease
MTNQLHASELTEREKRLLFWASFLSLTAAGVGFAFRMAKGGEYGEALGLSNQQVGEVFGASLWPIALTMIGFSLVVDRTGYRVPMIGAFVLQVVSAIGICMSESYQSLYLFTICAGLGHGIIEAVINPICAAVYPKEKTKWLTILHAAWPAGMMLGTLAIISSDSLFDGGVGWQMHSLWMVIPAVAYLFMYMPCKFPVDERVLAGVPYREMLQQVGALTAALAAFLMTYEIGNQIFQLTDWFERPDDWFRISLGAGIALGLGFGLLVGSLGRPLFFLMCLLMIPVATAELGTDAWIRNLMAPVLTGYEINPAMALVFSAAIMLTLRVFAGGVLKFFSPPGLLCVSGVLSAVGLYWLAGATGAAVFVAFVLYAMGQTYYWPCILGFTSERYPRGGALTLNTVSAIGLLSFGVIGAPILGAFFDESIHESVVADAPELAESATTDGDFMWMTHKKIDAAMAGEFAASLSEAEQASLAEVYSDSGSAQLEAGRGALKFAARFPALLFVVFGLIALYFRSKGGYKPIILNEE